RTVVIVSSAPEEVVRPLGEFLGVDDVIATRAGVDADGMYTGELEYYGYGPYKAEAVRTLAERDGIDLTESYAYSDSITDEPMLRAVGHPFVVNPDRELARVAREESGPGLRSRGRGRLRPGGRRPPAGPTLAGTGAGAAAGAGVAVWGWLRRREDARARRG